MNGMELIMNGMEIDSSCYITALNNHLARLRLSWHCISCVGAGVGVGIGVERMYYHVD